MNPADFERAEEALERDLEEGRITQADFNAEVRDLGQSYMEAREEAAWEAAQAEREQW